MRADGPDLIEDLKAPLNNLEKNCIDYALIAAVESGNHGVVGKLILRGASNIDEALKESRRLKRHKVTAVLLLIKVAMKNDRIFMLKIYGENLYGLPTMIPLAEEDDPAMLQQAVCSDPMALIEISKRSSAFLVREELILRMHADSLKFISWSGLYLTQLDISLLRKLQNAKKIELCNNEFTSFPQEIGGYLKQCTVLDMQWNKLYEIPSCLLQLPSLNTLNLSHNNLGNIPDALEWSASLVDLNLSFNHLSNLPSSVVASTLKSLNISNNQFHVVPYCVCSFTRLSELNISHNTLIRSLPLELGRLKCLCNLDLDGLIHLRYPPKSACYSTADCMHYLYNQLHNRRPYYHMKLMVVGKQGAGKSTMVARLLGKHDFNEAPVGLNISQWKYSPSYNKKTFHFTIWDFTGKDECYAAQQCFLSERTIYLLVWNVTEEDVGVTDLKPWFNIIYKRARKSIVIVVATFLDQVTEEDRQSGKIDDLLSKVNELIKQFHCLHVTNVAIVGLQGRLENVQKLKNYIYNAASEYRRNGRYPELFEMGARIPSSYHDLYVNLTSIHRMVKDGKHKPIMHAVEFKKMARNFDFDLQDDMELCRATRFLHEVGALLHFDDDVYNLNDLYFVDPSWLCDLIITIVSVNKTNTLGIVRNKNISVLLKDHNFPTIYIQQYFALLGKFEIVLPLVKDYEWMLIPSLLPKVCPANVKEQVHDTEDYLRRFILFGHGSQFSRHSTPAGLWSHLLCSIMNNIEEVRDMLSHQIPFKCPLFRDISVIDRSTLVDNQQHKDIGVMVYWRTGLFYNSNGLLFVVQSFANSVKHQDKDGISITCSSASKGCKVFCQLIDLVDQLISTRYPSYDLDHKVPCCNCVKTGVPNPYEFKIYELSPQISDHTVCGYNHEVQLINLAPDLLLADIDSLFCNKLTYMGVLETGAFIQVNHGMYNSQSVAIKLYANEQGIEDLRALRSESKALQRLCHPCIVSMIGVAVRPRMALVLEKTPLGTLQASLLKEKTSFSRIVMYRIAIQVACALHYLHSMNSIHHIIHYNVNANNVLLWSLSPDYLINCKVTDFSITYPGFHGRKGFIAPEFTRLNHLKYCLDYDHRADIFSFGMFLYQLIARRHPFCNVQPSKIEAYIEEGQRPQLEDIPIAETGLFYMTSVMKKCWAGRADNRPAVQKIINWLSSPELQLTMSVMPLIGECCLVIDGCIVSPPLSNKETSMHTAGEVWICCGGNEEAELCNYTGMKVHIQFLRDKHVQCVKQCGDHIWVASQDGLESGRVDIFNKHSKSLVHKINMYEKSVSCIINSDWQVYMGTMEGYCFAFPLNIQTDCYDIKPSYKFVSSHCLDGLVLTQKHLWTSSCNKIFILNHNTLEVEGVIKRTNNKHACIGKMMLCDNGDEVWSAHLGGVIMSSWDAHQCVHLCDVDVGVIAEEKCHVGDPRDQIITAMCTGLDTVWIGLASGHIIVFGMNPPGEMLTYFRPYHSFVRFLSSANCPGPCGKEECMMLSGGKFYQPDDSFKELSKDSSDQSLHNAGVVILWEVLPAKYVRQVHYLRDGKAWLNYDRFMKAMIDTGFADSLKHCSKKQLIMDCALIAAVESGNHSIVGKLMLHGASNIDKALEESCRLRKHALTAILLLIKAAMENDRTLILKLYGESKLPSEDSCRLNAKIPLASFVEAQNIICNGSVNTVIPIEISLRYNASAVREELLLKTNIDKERGIVLWSGLNLTKLEVSWLQNIYWVTSLALACNNFTYLPPTMGNWLRQCTMLNLQSNKLSKFPHCLLQLLSLNELNLSHNSIIEIPYVPVWSASLFTLDLSYNCLRSLPKAVVAPNLKNLNISNNQFYAIPHCVGSFVGLTTLNIAHNPNILDLPLELGRLTNLTTLNLDGLDNLNHPPRSVCSTTEDCIRYMEKQLCGNFYLKLMLVGNHAVGRSKIADQLQDQVTSNKSTPFVNISEWKYTPVHTRDTFHFSIWDFTGGEEYYAIYQCFYPQKLCTCLYGRRSRN